MLSRILGSTSIALALSASVLASDGKYTIRRETVMPVVMRDTLRIDRNRAGDLFYADLKDDRDLPPGTRLEGRVKKVVRPREHRRGQMELEFTRVLLPDGRSLKFNAVPVTGDRYGGRDRDGSFESRKVAKNTDTVLGGAIAGLVLGSAFKKPFEGTFVGVLAGILMSESDAAADN